MVDAAVTGDRQMALQALLLDPMVNDMDQARAILDAFLDTLAEYLTSSPRRNGSHMEELS